MVLGGLMNKVDGLTGAVLGGASKFLDEFNDALPTMRALGFTVKDFRMSMGLPPDINTKLIASLDTVNVGRINELIAQHKDQQFVVTLLKALQAAYHVKEQLGDSSFKSVEMDITLGLSPRVSVGFAKPATAPGEPRQAGSVQ
jgi:hypothetical protein